MAAAGVATVGELLDLSLVELRVRSGVGPKTELELGDLFEVLHRRFAGTPTPRSESLDACFEDMYPRPRWRQRSNRRPAVLDRFLGFHPGANRRLGPWPSQTAIAARCREPAPPTSAGVCFQ